MKSLQEQRMELVAARVRTEIKPRDEMTQAERRANNAAWDALEAFDSAHPEVRAEIEATHYAKRANGIERALRGED